jgi:glutamate decarboxylase
MAATSRRVPGPALSVHPKGMVESYPIMDEKTHPKRESLSVMRPMYARHWLLGPAARHAIPEGEMPPSAAYQLIHDELIMDGSSRFNLATFCGTWMEPEAEKLMSETFDKNMIDKDEYPQTAELEMRCVHMLAELWHSPDPEGTLGTSTIGSSEACMLGGLALKWRWREKMRKAGKSADRPNIVMGTNTQVCWHKFVRYWDVEERSVPLEGDSFVTDPERAAAVCDENTIGVVAVLGSTFTGDYEDVQALSGALDRLQEKTGLDIPIHVDGASGAFVAPFLQPEIVWDFRLPRVKSINTSGHKYGLVFPGVGWVLWREASDLHPELIFNVHWSLYDLADRLRDRGWQVPAYRMPANRQDLIVQRVVVRNGFTCDLADMLVRDIRRHLDWFTAQPGFRSTAQAAQFHH